MPISSSILLSLFKGYSDVCPIETTLETIVDMIRRHPSVADHTARFRRFRRQGQPTIADREKAACPCFAVAVRFKGGKRKEHIDGWTSLCLADFDHLPEEQLPDCLQLICDDPHTLLAYTTISGTGIRVISTYTAPEAGRRQTANGLYAAAFRQMNRHYAELIGHPYDEKCKNATRLSGLAHDPDAFLNLQAVPSP